MKVLVTGGTGFVGSHTVKAVIDAGHELRLLVRSAGRLAPALEPLGVRDVQHVVGDATDAEAVRRAMDGCDAVVHAAAIFSYDAREARAMQRVNARATEVVLGAAHAGGLDPIVHVSRLAVAANGARRNSRTRAHPIRRNHPLSQNFRPPRVGQARAFAIGRRRRGLAIWYPARGTHGRAEPIEREARRTEKPLTCSGFS